MRIKSKQIIARKANKHFANRIVISAIVAVMLYTALTFFVLYKTSSPVPDALTYSYFSFWAVEMVSLAGIKRAKTKIDYTNTYTENIKEKEYEDTLK